MFALKVSIQYVVPEKSKEIDIAIRRQKYLEKQEHELIVRHARFYEKEHSVSILQTTAHTFAEVPNTHSRKSLGGLFLRDASGGMNASQYVDDDLTLESSVELQDKSFGNSAILPSPSSPQKARKAVKFVDEKPSWEGVNESNIDAINKPIARIGKPDKLESKDDEVSADGSWEIVTGDATLLTIATDRIIDPSIDSKDNADLLKQPILSASAQAPLALHLYSQPLDFADSTEV